ncbi:hypothetical protein [Apibacter sp. HY039]|uniref:HD domain-containing protein n=1 Tax=Apibacter sp. HY039 TaxID=2501476 RepID=UPI000FEB7B2F|nr:hypothetical protein [Apibacter sp. HY039]
MEYLKTLFFDTCHTFTKNDKLVTTLWVEIITKYSSPKRHYHTLTHVNHLIKELSEVKNQFSDWPIVVLSAFYHDFIYDTLRKNNEEKSANAARKKLILLGCSPEKIINCYNLILATQHHNDKGNNEINYFTDADLAILGSNEHLYLDYAKSIRKEYFIYPDIVYNSGRKKVITHFLEMSSIFKTEHFKLKYEIQARINLKNELINY